MLSNELVNATKLLRCVLFADDTTLYYCGENLTQVINLKLNKTNFLIFGKDAGASLGIEGIEVMGAGNKVSTCHSGRYKGKNIKQ